MKNAIVASSGAQVIGIADSVAAPLRQLTKGLFFVAPTRSQAFPESSAGAVAIGNLLAALAIAKLGDPAYDRISRNEKFIVSSGEYMLANRRSRKRSKKE